MSGHDLLDEACGQLGISRDHDLAGSGVDNGGRGNSGLQVIGRNRQSINAGCHNFLGQSLVDLTPLARQNLAIFGVDKIMRQSLTNHSNWIKTQLKRLPSDANSFDLVEVVQQLDNAVSQSSEQGSYWKFAATINTHVQNILGIKLKVNPRATNGNNSR